MLSKGIATKERILDKAVRLVNERGIEATSINDLISATGMTKGSLYFHFPSKEALSLAVMERAEAEFLEFLDASLTGRSPAEKLESFFRRIVEKHKSTGFVGGCIFGNSALETSDTDRRMAAVVGKVFETWSSKIQDIVRDAQDRGQVRGDVSAGALARHMVMAIEGGIMLARLEKSEKPLKDCLRSLRTLIGLKR